MRRLAFRPAILRLMLPETHTTQPTPGTPIFSAKSMGCEGEGYVPAMVRVSE